MPPRRSRGLALLGTVSSDAAPGDKTDRYASVYYRKNLMRIQAGLTWCLSACKPGLGQINRRGAAALATAVSYFAVMNLFKVRRRFAF